MTFFVGEEERVAGELNTIDIVPIVGNAVLQTGRQRTTQFESVFEAGDPASLRDTGR